MLCYTSLHCCYGFHMEDTIAAISTPLGMGAIAIVRISGPNALLIGDAIFHSSQGVPSRFSTHTIHYGRIVHDKVLVDQVMLAVLRAPHSYTTEDTVEVHCHGGALTAQMVLSLCLQHGARLADSGEFTKRAFLNGRIDLTQAEAVMDLISAQTQHAQAVAAQALEGHLSRRIEAVRDKIAGLRARIEAHLDFPDEDIQPSMREQLCNDLQDSISCLQALLKTSLRGRVLRHGVRVAIIGRPNAGKSSIMNALLGRERSIVTPIAGTTRDFVEDTIAVLGFPVRLTDTAGYRSAKGLVESEGIKQTLACLERAEIVLHIIDSSRPYSPLDSELLHLCHRKCVIHVYNKIDLPRKIKLPVGFQESNPLAVSTLTREGIDCLQDLIAKIITSQIDEATVLNLAINERQAFALNRALVYLTDATRDLDAGMGIEILSHHLQLTLNALGEITGATTPEDILTRIFTTFCIGK